MKKESQIERAQRAISRIAKSENDAQELIQEMLSTDWEQVFASDVAPCQICNRPVQYRLVFKDVNGVGTYCKTCFDTPIKRYCHICKRNSPGHISMIGCDKCHTLPCIVCQKACVFPDLAILKICKSCKVASNPYDEMRKISAHLGRTNEINCPGALTLEEWLKTLHDFKRMCAYCLTQPYEHLEHFIPVHKGGKTTASNCVPSCERCNYLKRRVHPDYITDIPQEDLIRVFLYLETR